MFEKRSISIMLICNAIICCIYIISVTVAAIWFGKPAIMLWYILVLLISAVTVNNTKEDSHE